MQHKCLFVDSFHVVGCPYMDEYNWCEDITICPENGDSWCHKTIEYAHEAKILLEDLKKCINGTATYLEDQ